ncbi:MAG: hypothetical protein KJ600_01970 [Nanoarchaeota archaeon]|nr:hypothetical protein [Nanoarchaeota archaeon]MBU1103303.1 hypothetical protein [Nanoarchaeota archaeon]
MISKQKIKEFVKKNYSKKISLKAIEKLENLLEREIGEVIAGAARRADFSGRIVIKEEDIESF